MQKKEFKVLSFVLFILVVLNIISINAKAGNITYNDDNTHYFETTSVVEKNLYGVNYQEITGNTNRGESYVDFFSMKADGENSKLVLWSAQYENNRNYHSSLTKMAEDYEATHPGWKVVAGTNADQWTMGFGSQLAEKGTDYYSWQTLYPALMDGERRFAYAATGPSNNFVGFTNDGSPNGMVLIGADDIDGLYLEILDSENNILSKHPVASVNQTPDSGDTAVWFSYINDNEEYEKMNISGDNLFYVSNAELAYMNNSREYTFKGVWAIDSVFGRGTIDQVTNSVSELKEGQFVIDSSDPELVSKLDKNVRVRVQFHYKDEAYNNIEAGSGFHIIQRLNGVDQPVVGSYNTSPYTRSVFGVKEDGTYILMTSDYKRGDNTSGLTGYDVNALLKQQGVVTAFQCDGGGSVTAIFRNEDGGFDVVNNPTDGDVRNVLTGMFFVVKDSGIIVDSIYSTNNSITINVDLSAVNLDKVKKIYCTLNGETLEVVNNTVTFNDLTKMTTYKYSFTYDTADSTGVDGIVNGIATTAKDVPQFGKLKIEIGQNKLIFTPEITDPDEALDYYRIFINNKRNPYLDEPIEVRYTLDGLTQIEFDILVCVDLNDGRGKIEFTQHVVYDLENPTGEIQMENYVEDYLESLNPSEEDPVEEPESGCKKDLAAIVVTMISLSTTLVFFKKRR